MKPRPVPRAPLRASGDRWLFGYADVVTLLFACFASLYAARVDPPAAAAAATPAPPAAAVAVATARDAAPPSDDLADRLAIVLGRERDVPGIEVAGTTRGLVISLPEAGSFPPGRADVSDDGRGVLRDVADALRGLPNLIRVEGHTDNVPMHAGAFLNNWDLSTARATRVVQFLIEECGLEASRLSAAGYGEYRPRLPNDSPEARARNRRVDIVVLDAAAATLEEPGRVSR